MKRDQVMGNRHRGTLAGDRAGFTLVEMLTVIVIIGILAALISAATIYARARAREAAIYTQIKQMESALMEYKNQFGEFPPDFSGPNRKLDIERHIRRRWPRFTIDPKFLSGLEKSKTPLYDTLKDRLDNAYKIKLDALDARSALVFWLGGLPDLPARDSNKFLQENDVYKPVGFHADEANPIQRGEPRTGKFFDFDASRIYWSKASGIELIAYVPDKSVSDQIPCVVYFRSERNAIGGRTYESKTDLAPTCLPYKVNNNEIWRNPETFQLIHPGLDGLFGTPPRNGFPVTISGDNFTQGDYDNITNFAARLESEIE